jgi:hypothetical protein
MEDEVKEDDLYSYQSAETAWRYDLYLKDHKSYIEHLKLALAKEQERLEWLEKHPPLYHLFNWSA